MEGHNFKTCEKRKKKADIEKKKGKEKYHFSLTLAVFDSFLTLFFVTAV